MQLLMVEKPSTEVQRRQLTLLVTNYMMLEEPSTKASTKPKINSRIWAKVLIKELRQLVNMLAKSLTRLVEH